MLSLQELKSQSSSIPQAIEALGKECYQELSLLSPTSSSTEYEVRAVSSTGAEGEGSTEAVYELGYLIGCCLQLLSGVAVYELGYVTGYYYSALTFESVVAEYDVGYEDGREYIGGPSATTTAATFEITAALLDRFSATFALS
ncbi:MAG: hypothetical protein EZS28_021012 [Streblomastix strix]|uniref:Uncharacterized protein n=1 Tax=Streblomastix strix TaxID=222440 RepID=A0A5J4VLS2_9EUKA|nr:MAG: hypothetical protein EZS28_021012 [Streblomastix strix]